MRMHAVLGLFFIWLCTVFQMDFIIIAVMLSTIDLYVLCTFNVVQGIVILYLL